MDMIAILKTLDACKVLVPKVRSDLVIMIVSSYLGH